MKRLLWVLLAISVNAHADAGLDGLKAEFGSLIQSSGVEFDRAAGFKVIPAAAGEEISEAQCKALMEKVRPNYRVDPFQFVYDGGRVVYIPCSGKKFYLSNHNGVSNLGLAYATVITIERPPSVGAWAYTVRYFLDQQYRFVEQQEVGVLPKTGEILQYTIAVLDGAGNVYQSEWTKNYEVVGKDVKGTYRAQSFISADGSFPHRLLRRTVEHKDPAKGYSMLMLEKADARDWDAFELPFTHAWSGGFYLYGGSYKRVPNHSSQLVIKYLGGKEYCGFGSIRKPDLNTDFPADKNAFYNCVNY